MSQKIRELTFNQYYLVHSGDHSFPLADHVDGISASRICEDPAALV